MSVANDITQRGAMLLDRFGLEGESKFDDGELKIRVTGATDGGPASVQTRADFLCACRELPKEIKISVEVYLLNDYPSYRFKC